MLQASDYQARASVFPFANGYVLDNQYLRMQLLPAAIGLLSDTGPVQFRITLTYETFSNYDGTVLRAGQPPHPHRRFGL